MSGQHRASRRASKPVVVKSKRMNVVTRAIVSTAIVACATAASLGVPTSDPAPVEPALAASVVAPILLLGPLQAPLVEPPALTPAMPSVRHTRAVRHLVAAPVVDVVKPVSKAKSKHVDSKGAGK